MLDYTSKGLIRRLEVKEYVFDINNPDFSQEDERNRFYLKAIQNYFNDLLRARGYVFLNEVLERLGISPRMIGQLAGWTPKGFIEIEVTQTTISDGKPKEYFLTIEHQGIIAFDVLGD